MIRNKTIWMTGASSGIGRALALSLAKLGNRVIISARREEKLSELQAEDSSHLVPLTFDVSDDSVLEDVRQSLDKLTQHLDMVIMCAGTCQYDNNLRLSSKLYRQVFDVNFFGAVNTLNVAMPFLQAVEGHAQIVGIGSLSSVVGFPRAEAYGASKAALGYFLDSLRVDLSCQNMTVTHVRPGFVATDMVADNDFDMPYIMEAEEACQRIIAGIARRQRIVDFPKRLSWPLRLGAFLPAIWYGYLAPKMTRVSPQ